ncbi:MAG: hypothetical protein ABI678_21785, partial [Kofleriaceae bacterium]
MSKIECTAVNELIDLAHNRPMGRDSSVDMLFAPTGEVSLRRQVSGTPAPSRRWAEPARRPDLDPQAVPRLSQDLRAHAAKLTDAHEDFELTTDVPRMRRIQKKWDALPELVRKL